MISLEFISWEQMVNGGLPEDAEESQTVQVHAAKNKKPRRLLRQVGDTQDAWM